MKTAIHWFRRDLRLTDNTALNAAARAAERIVPVFVLSKWRGRHRWVGPNRQEFLCGCLEALARDLAQAGGRLVIRCGAAEAALAQLVEETGAEAIYFNRDPDPFGRAVEAKLEKIAQRLGIALSAHADAALHEGDAVLTNAGEPFRVYSPYFRAWSRLEKAPVGPRLRRIRVPARIRSLPLPTLAHWKLQSEGTRIIEPGERAARRRLAAFMRPGGGAPNYAKGRETLTGQGTTRFSQDLRWGLLSIREVHHRAQALAGSLSGAGRSSVARFLSEIAWRDFYFQVLFHFPAVLEDDFNPATRGLPWRSAARHAAPFKRWCTGTTSFPIVDAGMRQLRALGYMHNRLRMIVAMFLTKDLRIHWRDGEAHFMRHLVDGEIANNNGGWQWSAGTGADAAPYFRIQNPWTQSRRFDPQGKFIREWVPELRAVPAERLHAPPAAGQRLARDYPLPMVDHAAERLATLAMFNTHRAKHAANRPARPKHPSR